MKILNNKARREFYDLTPILQTNSDYNLIYGERSNGKSYAVKEYAIKRFLENGEQFVLVRRYDTELKRDKMLSYWSDMPIDILSNGEYNEIYIYSGAVLIAYNENGVRKRSKQIGFLRALNLAQSYSSTQYPKVTTIILEEFIALDGNYLPNELFLFNHLISTVARRRNVKIFMLANTISRISPYWREYSVDEVVKTQQQGTICLLDRDTDSDDQQQIAIEYCANTTGRSKMFARNRAAMTNEGKWLINEQPHLPVERERCECLYMFVVEYKKNLYLVEYLSYNDNYCLYVTPKTTPIKKDTRVISDKSSFDPLYSFGLTPINQKERLIFNLFSNGKVFYCDNQTGTEFAECLKNIKRIFT